MMRHGLNRQGIMGVQRRHLAQPSIREDPNCVWKAEYELGDLSLKV